MCVAPGGVGVRPPPASHSGALRVRAGHVRATRLLALLRRSPELPRGPSSRFLLALLPLFVCPLSSLFFSLHTFQTALVIHHVHNGPMLAGTLAHG